MINLHGSIGPGSNSRSLYQQFNTLPIALQGQVLLGFLFYLSGPYIRYSVLALFDCFGAILYELLIAGLIDLVYQSGAYAAFERVLVNKGKWHLFQGNRGRKANFWGEQRQYWGRGNVRKQNLREQRNKTIYFRGSRKHAYPQRGLRISLRRQNTTKVMAYNIARNSPL